MQGEIKKNNDITASSEQAAKLKALFPSCFDADGRFRPDKLEELLRADGADITREGYKLDWLGKSYARLLANLKSETLLAPNTEHNIKPENVNSQNLLIQGDNLDVLKHLVNAYSEEVKMIYIDPPYNTGSDGFVYEDDRKFTPKQLAILAGLDEDEAKRVLSFTQSNSNSHSAWLTFLYPRLYVARELLHDDGVIFVSIDNNEQAQLKLLCDEVFGEENFVAQFVHDKLNSKNDSSSVQNNHDYLLCYRRQTKPNGSGEATSTLRNTALVTKEVFEEGDRHYFLNDPITTRGDGGTLNKRENLGYTVYYKVETGEFKGVQDYDVDLAKTSNDENEVYTVVQSLLDEGFVVIRPPKVRGQLGAWTWELDKFNKDKDHIVIKETKNGFSVRKRTFISSDAVTEKEGKPVVEFEDQKSSRSILEFSTNDGTTLLSDTLGEEGIFSNPKNVALLQYIVSLVPDEDCLVLDFFAGSGSSAHAVMALNAEAGGSRKFISVQLDEETDEDSLARKAGYKTIFEITRQRILRAAHRVRGANPDATCDLGFKEFKTIPANDGPFAHYLDDADTIEDYVPFDGMALDDEALNALLATWKVYDGLPLHQELAPIDLGGYTAHLGEHTLYFVSKGLELGHITEMLRRIDEDDGFAPRKLVLFHHVFGDKILREFSEAVNAPNRKHLELTFEQRF